jgi:hypothetical protein
VSSKNRYDGLDAEVVAIVRRKAHSLIGLYGYNKSDTEDLEQTLMVHVLSELPRHNPSACQRGAFIERTLRDYVSELARRVRATKRAADAARDQLSDEVPRFPDPELVRVAIAQHRHARRLAEVAEEFSSLKLRPAEARLCELLRVHPLSVAAERLGLTRWQARELVRSVREAWLRKKSEDFPANCSAKCGGTMVEAHDGASRNHNQKVSIREKSHPDQLQRNR